MYIAVVDGIPDDDGTAGACYEATADDDAGRLWGWLLRTWGHSAGSERS